MTNWLLALIICLLVATIVLVVVIAKSLASVVRIEQERRKVVYLNQRAADERARWTRPRQETW